MDDPEQLARDRAELWLSLHVQLGRALAERELCAERIGRLDDEAADLLERIREMREEMT